MKYRTLLMAACLLSAAGGCTAGSARPPAAAVPSAPPSAGDASPAGDGPSCPDSIASVPEPGDGYRVVAADVAIPTDRVLQYSDNEPGTAGPERYFAKWGLLVRTGATADLTVPADWAARARVGWGKPGTPAAHARAVACTDATGWTVFAGGTWVSAPACVPLVINAGGTQVTVPMPIGVPC